MKSVREKIVKAVALLMALQFLDQITGFLKQVLIAGRFGTSEAMDGYLVAMAISGLVVLCFQPAIRQTLIPMFRYDLAQRGEPGAWSNFSVLLNNLALFIIFISVTGWLLASYLVGLVAPGFEKGTRALAVSLTQIIMANVIFGGIASVLSQIFLCYERFFVPGIVPSVNHLVIILGLLALGSTYGIHGLAAAVVLGAVSELAVHLPILWEKRKFYSLKVDLRHPGMIELGKLSFPLLISTGARELARITDRVFASLLPVGSLSALAFADRLIHFPLQFFQPLQKSTFPHFTKLTAEAEFKTLSRQLFHYLRVVFFLSLPMTIGCMAIAEPIVRAVYQRGAFDETSVRLTSQALFFYAIGLPAISMSRILNRTFFSLKDTWTPTKVALLRLSAKIILAWVLIQHLSHVGIALAESISEITGTFFLLFLLPDQVKGQEGWNTVKSFGRTLATSVLMLAVIYLVRDKIAGLFSIPLGLATLVLLSAATYGVMAFLFRAEEFQSLLKSLKILGGKYLPIKP